MQIEGNPWRFNERRKYNFISIHYCISKLTNNMDSVCHKSHKK